MKIVVNVFVVMKDKYYNDQGFTTFNGFEGY